MKRPAMSAREALAFAADHCFERRSSVPAKVLLSEALRHGVGAFDVADAWRGLELDGRFTAEVDGQFDGGQPRRAGRGAAAD